MRNGKLKVRRVRHYRVARYPSRHREAKTRRPLGRRALRAAAVPAVALGIGAAGAACDGGVNLVGVDPDAEDVGETTSDVADVTDAVDETTPDTYDPDSMIGGGRPEGMHYVRYLTEAEGRALILAAVGVAGEEDIDPCASPALGERLRADQPYVHEDDVHAEPVAVNVDLLAPEIGADPRPECPTHPGTTIGFEFMTDESGDDQAVSGDPDGLTPGELAHLADLRTIGATAISAIRAADYPYDVVDYGGWVEESDRTRAEELVRQTVRAILDELRRDGLL